MSMDTENLIIVALYWTAVNFHILFFYVVEGKRLSGLPGGKQSPLAVDIRINLDLNCVAGL